MAKFKKVIPALCMLVVSAIMAVSTTYAWFSMNTTVNATGMQVTAKSNATYLLIGAADNKTDKAASDIEKAAAFVSGGTNAAGTTGTPAANSDKKVYPAFYSDTATTLPGTAATTGGSLTIGADKWYTAQNANSDKAADKITSVKEISSADMVKHVCTYKVWLTLSSDSENLSKKVKITSVVKSVDQGTSAVVKIGDETLKLSSVVADTGTVTQTAKTTAAAIDFSATTSVEVTVLVYIDGTATNVTSNYINDPTHTIAGELELTFELVD